MGSFCRPPQFSAVEIEELRVEGRGSRVEGRGSRVGGQSSGFRVHGSLDE
jgi:hypothetical protein